MERAAHIATVAASIVAIVAFAVGLTQFNETQRLSQDNLRVQAETLNHERESKAVELFLKYNELQKEVASKPLPRKGEAAFWHHNMLLALTESVFKLTEGDTGWGKTVEWMLETQKPFLEGVSQGCTTFATEFVELMHRAAPKMQCT